MDVPRKVSSGRSRIPALISFLFLSFFGFAYAGTWTGTDIGSVGVAGTDSYNSTTGVYTIQGSGADIYNGADAFHFVYQTLTADGELVARVASMTNTSSGAKAGVMIRQSTAAGSIHASLVVTPGNGIRFLQRTTLNGSTSTVQTSTSTAPYWVKIVKDGTLISVYQSPDNVTWTYAGETRLTSLTNPVDIGFAVCSHSNSVLCTATFDNITLTAQTTFAPSLPWQDQDIGSPGQVGQIHLEDGQWSLFGGGVGVTGTSDSFHYASQPLSGNGVVIAQVNGLSASTASAGVVMRQDLTAGSAEAGVLLNFTSGISFATRTSAGGTVTTVAGASVSTPYWVKLVRAGNVFSGYQSTDGSTWVLVSSQTISMTGTIYVGVGGTSGNNSILSLSVLDQVQVIPLGNYLLTGAISSGAYHNLYLQPNGTVWAWGLNTNGQVGNGTTTQQNSPVQLTTLSGMAAVSAGASHSLALKNDGTVWVWGNNANGQLGDGTTTQETSPEQLTTLSGIVAISAGGSHSLALKSDGTVWAWGNNANGQLGDGTTTQHTSPEQLTTLSGIVAISAGGSHSLALKSDGTVWAWGNNANGQLGDGTTTQHTSPEELTGVSDMAAVSAGTSHSLALGDDGSVWAWGDNSCGEIGDGTTTQRNSPVQVTSLSSMISVQASNLFSMALKSDGTVWAWGNNSSGQLGNNTTTQQNSPVQASGLTGAVAISAGSSHSAAITSNNAIWTGGNNSNGQLGNGTTTGSTVPQSLTPVITSVNSATGTTGVPFSYQITATNSPTSFQATGLPSWLSINGSGLISGTPPATGIFTLAISATNLSGTGSATLTLTVTNSMAPVITSVTNATGTTSVPFNYQITATNSPTSFQATGLPSWLSINGSGLISGTPSATGTTNITISASNGGGTGTATLTLNVADAWTGTDIGSVGVAGTDSYNSTTGVYTIQGSGADIYNGADAFHFVYQTLTTDGSLVARVASMTNTSSGAKAGVMIRQSTAAGSIHASLVVTPGNGIRFLQRTTLNGSTSTVQTSTSTAPYWVKIVKAGTSITVYQSPDGVNWNSAGQTTLTSLTNPVDIGFAVCSHSNSVLCTATFDNITLTPAPTPVISNSTVASGVVGQPLQFAVTASNGPTSYSIVSGTLPSGLTISSTTGLITGTPTATTTGTTVTVGATNAYGTGTQSLTVIIGAAAPAISGLTAWFNADTGVATTNGSVTQWNDQSSNGNNISSATYSPTLTTDSKSGNSVVHFNGNQLLTTGASVTGGGNNVTIITVAGTSVPGIGQQTQVVVGGLYGGSNSARMLAFDNGNQSFDNNSGFFDGGPALVNSTLSINTATFNSASPGTATFYSQGVANGSASPISSATLSSGLTIGSISSTPYQSWNGNIAEVLIYNGVLTTTQRQSVEIYLADKYGIYAPNADWINGYSSTVQYEINRNHWNKAQADAYLALQANNPSMLTTGLKLWLKADSGVTTGIGSYVTSWTDQTGNYPVTQNGVYGQPMLVTNDSNGEPALRFSGSQNLTNPSSLGVGINADMTVITVGMTTTPSSSEYSLFLGNGTTTGETRALGYSSSAEYFNTVGGTGSTASGAAAPVQNFFVSEAASLNSTLNSVTFYRNGTQTGTGTLSGLLSSSAGTSVGNSSQGSNFWQGDISEVLVYDHQLSSTELQQVSLYLANKYGLYYPGASWISSYTSAVQTQINANQWNEVQANAYVQVSQILPVANGLTAWFKADSSVTANTAGQVTAWKDSSWNHNDVSQSSLSNAPTAGVDPGTGTRTVGFNTGQTLGNSNTYPAVTSNTIIVMASTPSPSALSDAPLVTYGNPTNNGSVSGLAYNWENLGSQYTAHEDFWTGSFLYHDGGALASTSLLTSIALSYSQSAGTVSFYYNGAANGTLTVSAGSFTNGLSLGSSNWLGNISEVLIYNRALSSTEIGQIQTYLAAKYPSAAAPIISPNGGNITTSTSISLSGATSPAVILYTLNGTTPTNTSTQYTGPLTLTQDGEILTCAIFSSGTQISQVASAQFWIGDTYHIGIPDAWQTEYLGSVTDLNPNALVPGGSGLTYLQAYQGGYNPTMYSTNGDGLSDLVNYELGYAGSDTDINGYLNGSGTPMTNAQQLALGLDPFDVGVNPPQPTPPATNPNDHTPPPITLTQPANATLLP